MAEVTVELLAHMGCEIEKVGDAAAALKAVEGGEFDLMLSDIVMAGSMNGLDLARAVRKKHPGFPDVSGFRACYGIQRGRRSGRRGIHGITPNPTTSPTSTRRSATPEDASNEKLSIFRT